MSLISRLRLELRLLSAFAKLSSSAVLLTFRLIPFCGSVRDFPRRPLGAAWAAFSRDEGLASILGIVGRVCRRRTIATYVAFCQTNSINVAFAIDNLPRP